MESFPLYICLCVPIEWTFPHQTHRRHATGRFCVVCGSELQDSIVYFGEKSRAHSVANWQTAIDHVTVCDVIICIGSSLKVLKSYKELWPKSKRVKVSVI